MPNNPNTFELEREKLELERQKIIFARQVEHIEVVKKNRMRLPFVSIGINLGVLSYLQNKKLFPKTHLLSMFCCRLMCFQR